MNFSDASKRLSPRIKDDDDLYDSWMIDNSRNFRWRTVSPVNASLMVYTRTNLLTTKVILWFTPLARKCRKK